jgi:hypothetical protein
MIEQADGHRVLLAPSPEVAEYVGSTYVFDEIRVGPVRATVAGSDWRVDAAPLDLGFTVGRRTALGRLLRVVPRRLATHPSWVTAIDVVARTVLPGVRTRGSAGGGRHEFYAALDLHGVATARVRWEGADQGALAPVTPPVRFGFGSAPRNPSLTRIVTLVREA